MLTSPAALTRKSILVSHAVKFSGRSPSDSGYQCLLLPTTPIQASAIRYSLRHSYTYPLNSSHGVFSKKLGGSGMGFGQLGLDNLRFSAVADGGSDGTGGYGGSGGRNSGGTGDGSGKEGTGGGGENWSLLSRIMKKLESMNTLGSSVCWVFGFYWIVMGGGEAFLQVCPHLFGLTELFRVFDVFFNIFCIGMACIIIIAFFYFVPLIATAALAYAIKTREGASDEDMRSLLKYRFSQSNLLVMVDDNQNQVVKARMDTDNSNNASELSLHPDDSKCCICLSPYVDGEELYRLPCTHHFHCECISRWLRTKSTCPVCRFDILRARGDSLV